MLSPHRATPRRPADDNLPPPTNRPRAASLAARRRSLTASGVLVTVVSLLLGNASMVSRQEAGASGSSVLSLSGNDVAVFQDGPRDAPALVLIHGLAASSRWWDRLVPLLASTHRVVRIDLLGHGRSAKPAGDGYAIPEQAARVGAALDVLGVRHAVVAGHSTGGMVATALAEQRRDLVSALVLIDTGPRVDAFISNGLVGQLLFAPIIGPLLWRLRTDSLIRRAASTAVSRPGYAVPQDAIEDVRGMTYHAFTATSQASDDYLRQRALPRRLTPLGKPLLVIFGSEDRRWQAASADDYRTVPGAVVELLPGIGHSPILEDPPRTAASLLAFVESHFARAN